jgi:uncharacterized metal-binding protein YceD (DUF177 family)
VNKSELEIRFSGLKEGQHNFHFEVGDTFFEQLDYSEIEKADLTVDVDFEKRTNMLILNFNIHGTVGLMCDKCTDDFELEIQSEEELIYKFGEGESDDEKIIVIPENEIEIDVSQPIYELTILAIPSKRVHSEGDCNQEMLEAMDDYLMVETDDAELNNAEDVEDQSVDPRWEGLNKLKK